MTVMTFQSEGGLAVGNFLDIGIYPNALIRVPALWLFMTFKYAAENYQLPETARRAPQPVR
jgi:hypothetical protein